MVNRSKFCTKVLHPPSPIPIHSSTHSESSEPRTSSLHRVKNEIQNVLDLMGPSTPSLASSPRKTRSTAKNDEPDEDTSISSSILHELSEQISSSSDSKATKAPLPYDLKPVFGSAPLLSPNHEHRGPHICLHGCRGSASCCRTRSVVPIAAQKFCKCVDTTPAGATAPEAKAGDFCGGKRSCELYRIKVSDGEGRPRRFVFDLVEGIPGAVSVATNTSNRSRNRSLPRFLVDRGSSPVRCPSCDVYSALNAYSSKPRAVGGEGDGANRAGAGGAAGGGGQPSGGETRVDFYYFDHGNAEFLNTTDSQPVMKCEMLAEKTEKYTTRFWAEFFASIHIVVSFLISFLLQLFKFLLYGVVRPLSVGVMQLGADYFFKPFLTTLFNGVLQPFLIFLYNVATTIRDLFEPVAECCGYFLKELGGLCKHIRLCNYKKVKNCDAETAEKL